jgi:hypothetical protein
MLLCAAKMSRTAFAGSLNALPWTARSSRSWSSKRGGSQPLLPFLMEPDADGSEPVRTGANRMEDELASVSLTEQVQTGANPSAPVSEGAPAQQSYILAKASTEPVRTSADKAEPVGDQGDVVKQLEARIEDLKSEIEFYRDELRDRRHTTEALTDVIEAFRLTAQSNASKAFERTDGRRSHDIRSTNAGDRWPGENAGDGV